MMDLRRETPGTRLDESRIGLVGKVGAIRTSPASERATWTVPRDSALPHLAQALDAPTMRAIFQRAQFAEPQAPTIQRCEIEWVKYRPGRNCTVAYRIGLLDRATMQESQQLLCARVFEPGRSVPRFQAVRQEDLVRQANGQPITHLPELDMIVWTFPNDSKLHALPRVLDVDRLRADFLPTVIDAAAGPGWSITDVGLELVQYVPEETCTVRVRAELERGHIGEQQAVVLYGKLYKEGQGADTYALMRRVWESAARQAGRLRVARPLEYDRTHHILWQSGLRGEALLEQDLAGPHAHWFMARAANAVAALHTSDVACSRWVGIADARSRLEVMRRLLPTFAPSCRETVEQLIDRLMTQAEGLGDQPVAVLHGDLRLRHILVDGDDVGLIDMDTLCHGSPWQDIGSLAAAILYKGVLTGLPDALIDRILATFSAHYARSVPWKPSQAALGWFTAAALINERVFRSITRLQADTLPMVERLITLASRISQDGELGRSGTEASSDDVNRMSPGGTTTERQAAGGD